MFVFFAKIYLTILKNRVYNQGVIQSRGSSQMSVINEKLLENLKVVKRNGKKVDFDTTKVAIAIKKGFDGANKDEDEEEK